MNFHLKIVESRQDWSDFIGLPWEIYKGDPNWVPPLRVAVRDTLDVNKNPFFRHAKLYPLIAYAKGRAVGRVVGVIDENHNQYHGEKAAFFGFFEAFDQQTLANELLDNVARWARANGMETLRGPMNPSTNHECGLLVDGFQEPPSVMMPYNPPYYQKLFETWGLSKARDLYAYTLDRGKVQFSEKIFAQVEKLKKGGNVSFRTLRMSEFDQEIERMLEIYNDAWEKNWGFVPMEPDEFRHMAQDLKRIVDPGLVLMAEVGDEPAGFALTLPDVNQALKKVSNGRLFPLGLAKLLWHLKGPARKATVNRCRILTLGVKRAYRDLGIGPLLYAEYLNRGPALGYPVGEASWILEDNVRMNRALEMMTAEKNKTYRIFERGLAA